MIRVTGDGVGGVQVAVYGLTEADMQHRVRGAEFALRSGHYLFRVDEERFYPHEAVPWYVTKIKVYGKADWATQDPRPGSPTVLVQPGSPAAVTIPCGDVHYTGQAYRRGNRYEVAEVIDGEHQVIGYTRTYKAAADLFARWHGYTCPIRVVVRRKRR